MKLDKNIEELSEKVDSELADDATEEMEKQVNGTAKALSDLLSAKAKLDANDVAKAKMEADLQLRTEELKAKYAELELNRVKLANDLEIRSKEFELKTKEVEARVNEMNANLRMAELKHETEVKAAIEEAKASKFASLMDMGGAVIPALIAGLVGLGSILAGCFTLRAAYDAADEDKVVDRQKLDAAKAAQNSFFRVR